MRKTYRELLRDPRWQRKRLEVLQRADWACEECDDDSSNLQIHHHWYENGRDPWDYPDSAISCLCEDCHETATILLRSIPRLELNLDALHRLVDFAIELKEEQDAHRKLADEFAPRRRLDELLAKAASGEITYEEKIELSNRLRLKNKIAPLIERVKT